MIFDMHSLSFPLAFLTILHFTTASPIDPLKNLQCRCSSYEGSSIQSSSNPCDALESQPLDWNSAQRLASEHSIPIQFSSALASKVLEADSPLPTSLLLRMSERRGIARSGLADGMSLFVCETDDEVRQRRMEMSKEDTRKCDYFIIQVAISLILLVLMYEAGKVLWNSIRRKFFQKPSPIRLSGNEKALTAEGEPETCSTSDSEKKASIPRSPAHTIRDIP
ncbi:hypothetical protein K469DRAFT_37035 [Zopfia rhizophila CBS 207.26]|uniref:Ig-like domain-containing protein n=1 Tax=Zopfia rhizophila CBS 207.26 TaxID=1314779 RepID=A0A6A6D9P0_9PEZI|nr:hypothetical protein K469DRAFT_37035 [Zopfia rhizophila CBS 207.26]